MSKARRRAEASYRPDTVTLWICENCRLRLAADDQQVIDRGRRLFHRMCPQAKKHARMTWLGEFTPSAADMVRGRVSRLPCPGEDDDPGKGPKPGPGLTFSPFAALRGATP